MALLILVVTHSWQCRKMEAQKSTILISMYLRSRWNSKFVFKTRTRRPTKVQPWLLPFSCQCLGIIIVFQCELRKCSVKTYPFLWTDGWEIQCKCKPHASKNVHCRRWMFLKKYLARIPESATAETEFPLKVPDVMTDQTISQLLLK